MKEVVGQRCPFEVHKVEVLTKELIEDLEIDTSTDHNDRRMLGELIVCTLIEERAIRGLTSKSLIDVKTTFSKAGKTYEKVNNTYLDILKNQGIQKNKLREKLVATKADRVKLNLKKAKFLRNVKTEKTLELMKEAEAILKPNGIGLISNSDENAPEAPVIDVAKLTVTKTAKVETFDEGEL